MLRDSTYLGPKIVSETLKEERVLVDRKRREPGKLQNDHWGIWDDHIPLLASGRDGVLERSRDSRVCLRFLGT